MINPFKIINKPLKDVPKELKAKVMNDIAIAKLLMDISELFSFNLGFIIDTVIKKRKQNNNKEINTTNKNN